MVSLLQETRDGPGGEGQHPGSSKPKVRLTLVGESAVRGEACAIASWAWAWNRLGFEHASFSATGEPARRNTWTGPVGARRKESDCAGLSNRDGRGSSSVAPPPPHCPEFGKMGGGCGLPEGIGGLHRK